MMNSCKRLTAHCLLSWHKVPSALVGTAYAASEVLAAPWPVGGNGDRWHDSYNFHPSSLRIHIEQAFRMLVWGWVFFLRALRVPFAKRPGLVRACFRLHNYCRDHAATGLAPFGDDRVGGKVIFSSNDAGSAVQRSRRRARERSVLRVWMTRLVEEVGIFRPGVAPMYWVYAFQNEHLMMSATPLRPGRFQSQVRSDPYVTKKRQQRSTLFSATNLGAPTREKLQDPLASKQRTLKVDSTH